MCGGPSETLDKKQRRMYSHVFSQKRRPTVIEAKVVCEKVDQVGLLGGIRVDGGGGSSGRAGEYEREEE